MSEFKVMDILDEAWELAKKHGIWMCLILLVIYIINYSLQAICCAADTSAILRASQSQDPERIFSALSDVYISVAPQLILVSLIGTALVAGFLNTALLIARGKLEKVNLTGFKMPLKTYVKYVLSICLTSIISGVGVIFCIIPGIYLFVRLIFVTTALVDDPELSFFDAYRRSWALTKGHFWKLFGLGILIYLINIVGLCCCCVGVLFTMTISQFAIVVAYLVLMDDAEPLTDDAVSVAD